MIGNHAVSIVAEAYHKGFRGFDAERAFNAIKRTQTVSHGEKYDWETYMKYGYWPTDLIASESVSNSLECMYDDYAAADMARLMGKKQDQQYFARRANFYRNLFDKQTNFMRPRLADAHGEVRSTRATWAHAETVGGDYTEGNAWQYTCRCSTTYRDSSSSSADRNRSSRSSTSSSHSNSSPRRTT